MYTFQQHRSPVRLGSLLLISGVVSLPLSIAAQFAWGKRVASTVNSDTELSIGLALDAQGNCYVTGWFDGTNDFGGVTLTSHSGGGQDLFVAKYNSNGGLQWARRAGGATTDWDAGRGVGVDAAGHVYVTGGFLGTADFGPFFLNAPVTMECFLAKYDSAGLVQWVRQSTGGTEVYGTGLAVDAFGNSYVVGYADNGSTITFGTHSLLSPHATGYSSFLVKYDSVGTAQWARLLGGPGQTYATKVALDAGGNVYARGSFSLSATIGSSNLVSVSASDMFIAKFDNAGNLLWARQAGGPAETDEGGIAVDSAGNVYTTGWYIGGSITFGATTLTNAGNDTFLAKYSSSGAPLWAVRAGGTNLDFFWDVNVDSRNDVFVTGVLGADAVAPGGSGGAVVAKYDATGALQWAINASGPPADPVSSIGAKCAVDATGNCYVAGWYQGTNTLGTTTLLPQGYWNFFLTKIPALPPLLTIYWSNNLPHLHLTGAVGNRYAVEYVNAVGATNAWQGLATNTLLANPLLLTDSNAVVAKRFYRARWVP